MSFDPEQLVPAGGEAYGHLFENRKTGAPLAVYWSFTAEFEAIQHEQEAWPISITCEWLSWSVRRWSKLEGRTLLDVTGPVRPEASLYFGEHHLAKNAMLRVVRAECAAFAVEMSVVVDVVGFEGPQFRDVSLSGLFRLPFTGIVLLPDNIESRPGSREAAAAALAPYAELGEYALPAWDRFRWLFSPK